MFKKSRIRIIAAMMGGFLLLFIGTLFLIYFSSYIEVSKENQEMLGLYAQAYWENGNPENDTDPPPDAAKEAEPSGGRAYRLLSFHSVAFSESGEVISIDNDISMGVSDEELTALSQKLMQKTERSGVFGSWVYHIESDGGDTLVVLMDNMIMSGNMGTLFRYTVLFGSITVILLLLTSFFLARRIVQPLEESYQKQKQFISDAGHELKTPIAVANTNLELLEREIGQNQWLDGARFENRRMAGLVRQLLELAKTESAKPQTERVDFGRIVTSGVLPFESVAFEKKRGLQTQIQDGINVAGNPEQLGNLVSILVDNALNYAPEHSEIFVSLKTERGRGVLTVSNEGAAIPKEQRENLFDRFYRMDVSRGGDPPHYGLGLAIAKAIVTSHRGKIEVICNKGRIAFNVSLPTVP